jgi:nitrite reductase/ring-hydroxylating ferredoxin subunit
MVTCPRHGWTFNLRTGLSTTGEGRIATHPVTVRGDDVLVAPP